MIWTGIPRTAAGRRLRRVLAHLAQMWEAGQLQCCLGNLPLLAELLELAGLQEEARVARQPWSLSPSGDGLPVSRCPTGSVYLNVGPFTYPRLPHDGSGLCVNRRRLFWFGPNRVRLDVNRGDGTDAIRIRSIAMAKANPTLFAPDTKLHPGGIIGILNTPYEKESS